MAAPEIATIAEVTAYLGLGSSLSDADAGLIQMLKGMVENSIRSACGLDLTRSAERFVRFLPESCTSSPVDPLLLASHGRRESGSAAADVLQLPHPFVRLEGLEVREDAAAFGGQAAGAFGDESLLEAGVDFYLDADETGLSRSGQLIRIGGAWPSRPRTVRVTYHAGFTSDELDGPYSDIKLVAIEETANWFRSAKSKQTSEAAGAIQSESIGGEYSVSYASRTFADAGLSQSAHDRLAPYVRVSP